MNNLLTEKQLRQAWQFALEQVRDSKKDPRDTEENHLAKCWLEGFQRSVLKNGYELCLKKRES